MKVLQRKRKSVSNIMSVFAKIRAELNVVITQQTSDIEKINEDVEVADTIRAQKLEKIESEHDAVIAIADEQEAYALAEIKEAKEALAQLPGK